MTKPIILIGTRQDIHIPIRTAQSSGREIIAIVDRFYVGKEIEGIPVIASDLDLLDTSSSLYKNKDSYDWFIATFFGGTTNITNDNENVWALRQERYNLAKKAGITLTNLISRQGYVDPTTTMGENNIFGFGSYTGAHCSIGNFNTVGYNVGLSHHIKLGNFNTFAGGNNIVGGVKLHDNIVIGAGCNISKRATKDTIIGSNVIISPGMTIMKSVPDNTIIFPNGKTRTNKHFRLT